MTIPVNQSATETASSFRLVELSSEPIELYKILKFEGLASSGGEAKAAVASGLVRVNGEPETRKRKKIHSGDTIEFNDEKLRVKCAASNDSDQQPKEQRSAPVQAADE